MTNLYQAIKETIQNDGFIHHISHIDLDGYGSQVVMQDVVTKLNKNKLKYLKFYNANYGKILNILENLKIDKNDLVLITDLNLNEEEVNFINNNIENIYLYDHHATGAKFADKNEWYNLQTKDCATKFLLDTLSEQGYRKKAKYEIVDFAKMVDIYDLYKDTTSELWRVGKSLTWALFDAKNDLPDSVGNQIKTKFLIHIIKRMFNEFYTQNIAINEMEKEYYNIKRWFIEDQLLNYIKNIKPFYPYSVIKGELIANLLSSNKDIQKSLQIEGKKLLAFYDVNDFMSDIASNILETKKFQDYDFVLGVSEKGTISVRSKRNDINLGAICNKYFNGGGHPKAAGGSLKISKKFKKASEAFEALQLAMTGNEPINYEEKNNIIVKTVNSDKKEFILHYYNVTVWFDEIKICNDKVIDLYYKNHQVLSVKNNDVIKIKEGFELAKK